MAKLPLFDCNVRIGRCSVPREEQFMAMPELLAEMDRAGIEKALVWHAWALEWDPVEGNKVMLAEAAKEERIHPCLAALPPATRELPPPREWAKSISEAGGAVRLFPKEHQYLLNDDTMGPLLDVLGEEHVPVLVHISETDWGELGTLLAQYPAVNFIVLGVYYRVDRYLYPLFERYGNLHVESGTYGPHRGIEAVCKRFGAERLVFGTNLPSLEVGGSIAMVTYADISDEEKRLIAGGNLGKLLGEAR